MENIMEKEPTLIEQKFEDAVKNFRQEMEKGKGKFSFCVEIERSVSGKRVLVQVYERYFLYPNICATATFFFEGAGSKAGFFSSFSTGGRQRTSILPIA